MSSHGSAPGPLPSAGTARASRRGIGLFLLGVVAAGGVAAAVFFAMRAGDAGPSSAGDSNGPAPAPSLDSPEPGPGQRMVVPDFSVKPERKLYGGDETDRPASSPPAAGMWDGGWWKDSSGALELDIPKGFSVAAGASGAAPTFAGTCGGVPCTIETITSPTYGLEVDDGMIAQMVAQMPAALGRAGKLTRVRVQGRDHHSVMVDNSAEGVRGQVVVFHEADVLAIVVIRAPQASFDDTADFRETFFEKRVRMRAP